MEEESKISFFKKIKLSIFNLERYQELAGQKIKSTIGYLAILMLIFSFFSTMAVTYIFSNEIQKVGNYIDENIDVFNFTNGILYIQGKDKLENEPIIIDENSDFEGKIIIDTGDLSEEKIEEYKTEISSYYDGIIILKDKTIMNNSIIGTQEIVYSNLSDQVHIVKIQKEDVVNFIKGNNIYQIYAVFFVSLFIVFYINNLALVLLDAIMYAMLGYIIGGFSRLRLKFGAIYNIAVHSLTLPILLKLVYNIINILTGYTISYFSIMYVAITCIYLFAAILMIKSDIIKKQIELSKIIEEQERIKQEMARKELEKKEQEEKERVRKKDEKQRKEEKNKDKDGNNKDRPEPQANIKTSN